MRQAKPVRSALFVPGNREDRMQKAPRFGADALILDLEDAVAMPDKPKARPLVRKMVEELGKAGQTLFVRVTAAETAIFNRIQAMSHTSDGHAERWAIEDALAGLRALKRDNLGFPDWEKK